MKEKASNKDDYTRDNMSNIAAVEEREKEQESLLKDTRDGLEI